MWRFILVLLVFVHKNTETRPISKSPSIISFPGNQISVYPTFGRVTNRHQNNFSRLRRDADFYENTKNLIDELIRNLYSEANEAIMKIDNFTEDVEEQARQFKNKVATDINELKDKIRNAQSDMQNWWDNTSEAVGNCIKLHEVEADALFNEVVEETERCIDNEINKITDLIILLDEESNVTMTAAETIFDEMEICTQERNDDISTKEQCLAKVFVRNKKKAILIGKTGLLIGRTSFAVLNFPNELEKCLTSFLVDASLKIGRIIVDIGGCSISSVLEDLLGDDFN